MDEIAKDYRNANTNLKMVMGVARTFLSIHSGKEVMSYEMMERKEVKFFYFPGRGQQTKVMKLSTIDLTPT